jgi:putative ABC transport system permease protein
MVSSTFRIAWRNMGRNRKRTALALAAIALGQATLVFVNCMMAGMFDNMLQTITGPLVGHVQIHHKNWREEQAIDLLLVPRARIKAELERLPDVRRVQPRIYGPVLAASGESGGGPADAEAGMAIGVDADMETREGGLLESLPAGERPGNGRVVVGRVLARRLGLQAGMQIALIGQDVNQFPASDLFTVSAVVRSLTDVVNRMGIVMSLEDAGRFLAIPDQAHEIVVQGADLKGAGALAQRIRQVPGLEAAEVLGWREAVPELVLLMDMKGWLDVIFVLILFVAAAAGIANTMTMSTFERTHEFGMLLAIGSRPARIVKMVFVESLMLGLLGVAIGSLLGSALTLITSHTGIDYAALTALRGREVEFTFKGLNISYLIFPAFEWRHVLFGFGAVTVTSVLAAVWPALWIGRLQPMEALRS